LLETELLTNLLCDESHVVINISEIRKLETIFNTKNDHKSLEYNDNNFMMDTYFWGEYSSEVMNQNDTFGLIFSTWIKNRFRMNIVKWSPNTPLYPRFMFLGTDKGILAYLEFFYHESKELIDDEMILQYGICHEMNGLKKRIALVNSHLDRPVFYVHILNYEHFKGIFFETTDMIKNNIFESNYTKKTVNEREYYFTNIGEMGSLDELINMFGDLKKNNIKFY